MKKLILALLLTLTVIGCGGTSESKTIKAVQNFKFDKPYEVNYIDGSTFDIETGLDAVAYVAALNEVIYVENPEKYINSNKEFAKLYKETKKTILDPKKYTWTYNEDFSTLEIISTEDYNRNFWMNITVGKDNNKVRIHPKGIGFDFYGEHAKLSDFGAE